MNINDIINKDCSSMIYSSCSLGGCILCERGTPDILLKKNNWGNQIFVSMYTISIYKNDKWVTLRELYSFFNSHKELLNLNSRDKLENSIRKCIQDNLNHKNIFISLSKLSNQINGTKGLKTNGYWSLLFNRDPWLIKDQFIISKILKNEGISINNNIDLSQQDHFNNQ